MTNADTSAVAELSWRHSWLLRWGVPALLTLIAIGIIWTLAVTDDKPVLTDLLVGVSGAALCMCYARYLDRAKRIWLSADEVIVSDYRQTITIPRAEIATVEQSRWLWPVRVRIELERPSVFGTRILFFPSPALTQNERRQMMASMSA